MAGFEKDNERVLELAGNFLLSCPRGVTADEFDTVKSCGVSAEEAFALLFCAKMGIDTDSPDGKALYRAYIQRMFRCLDDMGYEENPYRRAIRFGGEKCGEWELREDFVLPLEAFVADDLEETAEGRVIPRIGFFTRRFTFPAVYERGRVWMSVTPNEIATMEEPISVSRGRVLTYGLGMGYFAFMAAEKPEVSSVTVVEKSKDAISLFTKHILPRFECKEKISIICADAFEYAEKAAPLGGYDFVFADLWHDVSDGLPMYERLLPLEKLMPRTTVFRYWIEKTMKIYM
ncbi:MAG: hypothetical protein PHI27_01980 [Eubacteriales bacterium]|nr:hypothetical protein [Eubacteriales bacterium]MDD3881001.1 hypothetical protein [Eubacteriales bacterium]MDD4511930.1 hypothetical protein [Eubacteriales bacterium]